MLRNICYLKGKHNFRTTYQHVKAHQDDIHAFDDLPLVQQFNVICDTLAKQAVQAAITNPSPREALHQLLPCEQAALIVNGQKQTTDVSTDLRFYLGIREAWKFFTQPICWRGNTNKGGLGWSHVRFDCIDWKSLHLVISQKPEMYGVWLSKQTIGICATRHSMARILGSTDDRCPNCLSGPERNTHLNRCRDQGRTLLFESDLNDLRDWLLKTTDRELAYWLYHYWLLRGEYTMTALGITSQAIREIVEDFDIIGWDDTLHGRLPLALLWYQTAFCSAVNSRLSGTSRMKTLVTKLLTISHKQWLFRNFSLHNKVNGHLKLTHQATVLAEIARLSTCSPEEIPEECRFLLDFELTSLDKAPISHQEYWIAAMKAAKVAGSRRAGHSCRHSSNLQTNPLDLLSSQRQRRSQHLFNRRIQKILQQMREDLDMTDGIWRDKRSRPHSDAHSNENPTDREQ